MDHSVSVSDESLNRRPSAVSFNIPTSSSEGDLSTLYGDQDDFEKDMPRIVITSDEVTDNEITFPDPALRRRGSISSSADISFALPTDSLLIGLSIIYAFVMSIVGLLIPIAEALTDRWLDTIYGAVFFTYQLTIGILFLLYLQFYNLIHGKKRQKITLEGEEYTGNISSEPPQSYGSRRPSISSSTIWVDMTSFGDVFTHPETSLFLRVGTLAFSLGNLIYYGFEIAGYMYMDPACRSGYRFGWTFYLRFAFILLQTYFLFKDTGISLNKHIHGVWFGMLHLISTNICLWFRTVVYEIYNEGEFAPNFDVDPTIINYGVTDTTAQIDVTTNNSRSSCNDEMLPTLTLYLFPFILEYSLIAVGTITSILSVMVTTKNEHGHRIQDIRNNHRVVSLQGRIAAQGVEEQQRSAHAGESNLLGKSHKGFFLAALVIAGIAAAVILFYLIPRSNDDDTLPTLIYHATDVCLHVFLLGGCVIGFVQMRPLGFIPKTISTDDVLIVIAMCGSVMFETAEIISSSDAISRPNPDSIVDVLRLSASLVTFTQVVTQALFLICSLRRYPSDTDHIERKPGRGAITTLVIGNAAVWVFQTILVKGSDMTTQKSFFGDVPWLMMMDLNLPLALFFCFHSSICFADVWHHAYAPLESDNQMSRSNSMSNVLDAPSTSSHRTPNPGPLMLSTSSPIYSIS